MAATLFDGTGEIARPVDTAVIPGTTDTMVISASDGDDDADSVTDDRDDAPAIARWIVAAVTVLVVVVGGFLLFSVIQKDSYAVPALTGVDVGEATNLVTEYDWTIVEVEEASEDVPAGAIVRTDPETGKKLQSGKTITFVVSTGPPRFRCPN